MDIGTKLSYIKQHIYSILTHDDAPIEEIHAALADITSHLAAAPQFLIDHREQLAAAAKIAETVVVTAEEVGDAASILGL